MVKDDSEVILIFWLKGVFDQAWIALSLASLIQYKVQR